MHRSVAVLLAAASAFAAPPAHAGVSDPSGYVCSLAEQPASAAGPARQYLSGGPLVLRDDVTGAPGSGTLVCRLQYGVSDYTGSGPSVSAHGTGVVVIPSTPVAPVASPNYLCTEFHDDATGVWYYLDSTSATWSTNVLVPCGWASG